MNRSESPLEKVQRWMQAVIMHPDGVEAGLDSVGARNHIDLPPDQVELLIQAGHDALSVNAKFRAFLASLGRTPPSPIERPPAPPQLPLPPAPKPPGGAPVSVLPSSQARAD